MPRSLKPHDEVARLKAVQQIALHLLAKDVAFSAADLLTSSTRDSTSDRWRGGFFRRLVAEGYLTILPVKTSKGSHVYDVPSEESRLTFRRMVEDSSYAATFIPEKKSVDQDLLETSSHFMMGAETVDESLEREASEREAAPSEAPSEDSSTMVRMVEVLESFSERMSGVIQGQKEIKAELETWGEPEEESITSQTSASASAPISFDAGSLVQIVRAEVEKVLASSGFVSREVLVRELELHREKLLTTGPRANLLQEFSRLREEFAEIRKELSDKNELRQMTLELEEKPILGLIARVTEESERLAELRISYDSSIADLGVFMEGQRLRDTAIQDALKTVSDNDAAIVERLKTVQESHLASLDRVGAVIEVVKRASEHVNNLVQSVNMVSKIANSLEDAVEGLETIEENVDRLNGLVSSYHELAQIVHRSLMMDGLTGAGVDVHSKTGAGLILRASTNLAKIGDDILVKDDVKAKKGVVK